MEDQTDEKLRSSENRFLLIVIMGLVLLIGVMGLFIFH